MGGAGRAAAILSFRLGGPDGVSVVAQQWHDILSAEGWRVRTVAGEGPVDVVLPGLAIDAPAPPPPADVESALAGCAVVVVENLCSLPLNPAATDVVARALAGRPAVLHHHDLPWQRERFAHVAGWPPHDPAWVHVTINELTRAQLAERGVPATLIRNGFAVPPTGDPAAARRALGVGPDARLAVHPVRAIARKDVPAAVRLAHRLGAHYWLLGPAEEGYEADLARALAGSEAPVHHGMPDGVTVADAYAASDVVLFPSTWEGFGNPVAESALHRRPLAIRRYPVTAELEQLGLRWFDVDDPAQVDALDRFLDAPDHRLLDHNLTVVRTHLSVEAVAARLVPLVEGLARG